MFKKLIFFIRHVILRRHDEIILTECICKERFIDNEFSWGYSLLRRLPDLMKLFREYYRMGKRIKMLRKETKTLRGDELTRMLTANARTINQLESKRDQIMGRREPIPPTYNPNHLAKDMPTNL